MIEGIRILDWLLYALTDYILYIPLVFFPFRRRLRYSKPLSYGSLALISLGYVFLVWCLIKGVSPGWITILSVIVGCSTMFWGLKVHPGKCLTVLLMEYSNASFIAVTAKNLEMYFFPERIHTLYGWTHSAFIMIGVVLLYLFDYLVTWKMLEPVINDPKESRAWDYIWITPFSFYIVWFIYTYSSESYLLAIPENIIILSMLIVLEVGSMATYFIILQLLHYESEKARLEYQEELNQSQYKRLKERIDETRKSRHDLRHHFLVLETLAKEENLQGIREYLGQFSEKQAGDDVLIYCEHFAANALFSYYSRQAEEEGVQYAVRCNIASELGISDKDLTIILGNLLENAMNACRRVQDQEQLIRVLGRYEDAGLLLRIENTALSAPSADAAGRYRSTSHAGYGTGIESVETIVQKYNGTMRMDFNGGIVSITIMLMV